MIGCPTSGCVFMSLADRDKAVGAEAARRFVEAGFRIVATAGTADALEAANIPVETRVAKVGEPTGTDAVELISSGKVDLVVNSPRGRGARADGAHIRAAAAVHGVPCLTTAAAGLAAANGIVDSAVPRDARANAAGVPPRHRPRPTHPAARRRSPATQAASGAPSLALRRSHRSMPAAVTTVDLTTSIGSVVLPNPVMTASGTAGHGAELAPYVDLGSLGAVVVKSLSAAAWEGNPALRVHETVAGMINSVGLQGPGVEAWMAHDLPALAATGARIVASIWGRTIAEYEAAARLARRRSRVGRRRRGEPLLPEHRGRPRPVRPLGRGDARRHGGHRARAVALVGPSSART